MSQKNKLLAEMAEKLEISRAHFRGLLADLESPALMS